MDYPEYISRVLFALYIKHNLFHNNNEIFIGHQLSSYIHFLLVFHYEKEGSITYLIFLLICPLTHQFHREHQRPWEMVEYQWTACTTEILLNNWTGIKNSTDFLYLEVHTNDVMFSANYSWWLSLDSAASVVAVFLCWYQWCTTLIKYQTIFCQSTGLKLDLTCQHWYYICINCIKSTSDDGVTK